jgi:hypothetical protein
MVAAVVAVERLAVADGSTDGIVAAGVEVERMALVDGSTDGVEPAPGAQPASNRATTSGTKMILLDRSRSIINSCPFSASGE